ncbi:MAG: class I SAM-dependent methyltransferase [Candidatus Binatia bacterium]|nr:class I SAM-dependent methyltransferase [Candidatus Binatia bacterium]
MASESLRRPEELKSYYRDERVVETYLNVRTAQPLNGLLHRRQVALLNGFIAATRPSRVLELACGPGRLTAEMLNVASGVAVDASAPMLRMARQRTRVGSWAFLRCDAFRLPFRDASFELVYSARFVRHFELPDRRRLYAEVQRVLSSDGWFVVDALNFDTSYPARLERGLEHYKIYDVLYRPGEAERELTEAGFRVVRLEGILKWFPLQRRLNRLRFRAPRLARQLIELLEKLPGNYPQTWMIFCQNKGLPPPSARDR